MSTVKNSNQKSKARRRKYNHLWQDAANRCLDISSTDWYGVDRDVADWDGNGLPISYVYGNDAYFWDQRSETAVGVLREFLNSNDILELGFSVAEGGDSWGMLVFSGERDVLWHVLQSAWSHASEVFGSDIGSQDGDVPEAIESIWLKLSAEHERDGIQLAQPEE